VTRDFDRFYNAKESTRVAEIKRRECSIQEAKMATQAREQREPAQSQAGIAATENDWTKPRAMAIPKKDISSLNGGDMVQFIRKVLRVMALRS